jgi:CBS domain-containing protein
MPIDAANIMTRDVITVSPDATVAEAAKVMTEHAISAMPVCDKEGRLVGMVSEGDLMRPFGEKHALRRAWWLNLLAEGTELAPEFLDCLRMDRHRVRDLMTKDVVTATETTKAVEIADLLSEHHIKRVPIVRNGEVVGIVSRANLIRTLAHTPEAIGASEQPV